MNEKLFWVSLALFAFVLGTVLERDRWVSDADYWLGGHPEFQCREVSHATTRH